jgi:hypothetical protein
VELTVLDRFLTQSAFVRALILALLGPVLGFLVVGLMFPPFFLIAAFLGTRLLVPIYALGIVPSVITAGAVVWYQLRCTDSRKTNPFGGFAGALSSAAWAACWGSWSNQEQIWTGSIGFGAIGLVCGLLVSHLNRRMASLWTPDLDATS